MPNFHYSLVRCMGRWKKLTFKNLIFGNFWGQFKTICVNNMFLTCSAHVLDMFCSWNFLLLNLRINEQSVVILWVNWRVNKYFWQRFTCTWFDGRNNLKNIYSPLKTRKRSKKDLKSVGFIHFTKPQASLFIALSWYRAYSMTEKPSSQYVKSSFEL